MSTDRPVPTNTVLGLPLAALTMAEVVALCDEHIRAHQRLLIGVVNAAKVVNMRRDAVLRAAVLAADLLLADGMAVVWAAWLLRRPLPERVAGIDLFVRLLEQAHERHYRVYCLGATGEVLAAVVQRIQREYSGVQLVGWHDGYFAGGAEERVVAEIAAAAPDILFVAMSSPKKEQFLARWIDRMQVTVCHGVGGSFDVLAGKVRRAPVTWRRLGLEWLYRVVQEPRRMWRRYLVTNTLFSMLVLRELLVRSDNGETSGKVHGAKASS